jgi:hypothetical protein
VEALLQYCLVVLVAQFGTKASLRTAGKGGEMRFEEQLSFAQSHCFYYRIEFGKMVIVAL